jgi:hypothetical protein
VSTTRAPTQQQEAAASGKATAPESVADPMANYDDSRPPMNRAERRAHRRRLLFALKDSGCRCSPTITVDPSPPPGVPNGRETGWVEHRDGCPLLLRLALAHRSGRNPMLTVDGVRGCER